MKRKIDLIEESEVEHLSKRAKAEIIVKMSARPKRHCVKEVNLNEDSSEEFDDIEMIEHINTVKNTPALIEQGNTVKNMQDLAVTKGNNDVMQGDSNRSLDDQQVVTKQNAKEDECLNLFKQYRKRLEYSNRAVIKIHDKCSIYLIFFRKSIAYLI